MGSYGIGPSRLMGTIAEVLSDEKGLVWPKEVAPFAAHLVRLGSDEAVRAKADDLYSTLRKAGTLVLYDDRDISAGAKFADSDLMVMQERIVVSTKNVAAGHLEVVDRRTGEKTMVSNLDGLDL